MQFQLLRQSGNKALSKIKIPTLLFTGGKDRLVKAEPTAELMKKNVKNLTHLHYPNGKHQLQIGVNQDNVEFEILNFIQTIIKNFSKHPPN